MILSLHLLHQDLIKLHIFLSLLRSLQCDYDKNILFISTIRGLRCKKEKSFCFPSVLLLLSQRHDQEKKFLFSFTTLTTLWSQEKEIWFLLDHYLDCDHENLIRIKFFPVSIVRYYFQHFRFYYLPRNFS